MFSMEEKKTPKNPRQIDYVLDSAVAEAVCVCVVVSFFVHFLEIDNRQGSFNCVHFLIVMETVEKDLTLCVSNFMCGLLKSVWKKRQIIHKKLST